MKNEIEEIKKANKVYINNFWHYQLPCGQILITAKTEKGLNSAWVKYLKVWEN